MCPGAVHSIAVAPRQGAAPSRRMVGGRSVDVADVVDLHDETPREAPALVQGW